MVICNVLKCILTLLIELWLYQWRRRPYHPRKQVKCKREVMMELTCKMSPIHIYITEPNCNSAKLITIMYTWRPKTINPRRMSKMAKHFSSIVFLIMYTEKNLAETRVIWQILELIMNGTEKKPELSSKKRHKHDPVLLITCYHIYRYYICCWWKAKLQNFCLLDYYFYTKLKQKKNIKYNKGILKN